MLFNETFKAIEMYSFILQCSIEMALVLIIVKGCLCTFLFSRVLKMLNIVHLYYFCKFIHSLNTIQSAVSHAGLSLYVPDFNMHVLQYSICNT